MTREFVSYTQALALKELGFDERCFRHYNPNGVFFWKILCSDEDNDHTLSVKDIMQHSAIGYIEAPFYFQAFNWFREKYGLFVAPSVISYEGGPYLWFFEINSITLPFGTDLGETDDFETYEEAEQACLDKLIEIIKKDAHI